MSLQVLQYFPGPFISEVLLNKRYSVLLICVRTAVLLLLIVPENGASWYCIINENSTRLFSKASRKRNHFLRLHHKIFKKYDQTGGYPNETYDKGNYVIAGGDFNQTFSGTDTSMYPLQSSDLCACGLLDESSFSDSFTFQMDNSAPTCRSLDRPFDSDDSTFQFYLIDGFIVSDNIEVETLRTLDKGFVNSDHNPVYMTFSLKDAKHNER